MLCPFNSLHRIPKVNFEEHLKICENKVKKYFLKKVEKCEILKKLNRMTIKLRRNQEICLILMKNWEEWIWKKKSSNFAFENIKN